MTRRLALALVATVVVTLLIAGAVTVAIARSQAVTATTDRLRQQAESVAATAAIGTDAPGGPRVEQITRRVLRQLRAALRLDGIEFLAIGRAGRLNGTLPDGVSEIDLDLAALRAGTTLSGSHGTVIWAAAPQAVGASTVVAVVTAEARSDLSGAVPWFLASAAVTLVLGAAVAIVLGRRLARPVRAAGDAAHRIASGDFSTRLPEPAAGERDELAELARSLNVMAAELDRARTLDQQFLLSVGHDLRTPLTSIRGYAEAITDGTAPNVHDAVAVIAVEAERLDRLVADLLTLARLDGRAYTLHPEVIDLAGPVGDAVRAVAPAAEAAGVAVTLRAAGVRAMTVADPVRVGQVLGNLLTNAARFARTSIEVAIVADGADRWLVRVDDDGPGIPPSERSRVFERLYATRREPDRTEAGTGLGLAIVQQLATAMGATVRADESPAGGARMEVRFPAI